MAKPVKEVSILLSCFNGDKYVEGYIDYLLENGFSDVCTLIAVNFPGSHEDPAFVEYHLGRFPDLVLLNRMESKSLYDAWNTGIKHASTEYVCNLNLDDRVSADYFHLGVRKLEQYEADVFSSFSKMTSQVGIEAPDASPQDHLAAEHFNEDGIAQYGLPELVGFKNGRLVKSNIPHCAPIWKRELHEALGYFDSHRFDFAADYEFWLKCAAAGKKLIVTNKYKTLFYSSQGTASDRLQHEDNIDIVNYWETTFPPLNYQESHLGRWHDKLHHCMNMNCVFGAKDHYSHLAQQMVSIVVVAHDKPDLLLMCLRSILAQSYPLFECIVVLDNDRDNALRDRVDKELDLDSRFLLVSLSNKKERNYCRNLGIGLSTGNWVTIVDGDDLIPRNSLAVRVQASHQNSDDIIFGWMRIISGEDETEEIKFAKKYDFNDLRIGWPSHCMLLTKRSFLPDTCYPASATDSIADASEIAGEDVTFMHELLLKNPGSKFINCDRPVYTYRRHQSSSYTNRYRSIRQVVKTVLAYHGEPDDTDPQYKTAIVKRCIGYLHWLAYKVADGSDGKQLPELAEQKFVTLAKHATRAQLADAERLFFTDIGRLNVLSRKQIGRLVEQVRRLLGNASSEPDRRPVRKPAPAQALQPYDPSRVDFTRLHRWKNRHAGENCVLLCNGPSLNQVLFDRIDTDRYVLFGLNKIFLGFENLGITPDYIAAVNEKVLGQSLPVYRQLAITKFLTNRLDPQTLPQSPYTYYFNSTEQPPKPPRFSLDISSFVNEGWTVTHAALQIIYYMGFQNTYIVGMDHRFSQHLPGRENQSSVIQGKDVDHFHPDYFGNGHTWDFPDLANSEISYQSALEAFNAAGRSIYDCTIGGACTVFPKLDIRVLYFGETAVATSSIPRTAETRQPAADADPAATPATTRICYFPAFSEADDINFSLIRCAWYIAPMPGAEIRVFSNYVPASLNCYDYYDPEVDRYYQQLLESGRLRSEPYAQPKDLLPALRDADVIICWNDDVYLENSLKPAALKELRQAGKKIYRVGAKRRMESSLHAEVSKDLLAFTEDTIAECRQKFERVLEREGGKENAYLFATGPSSGAYARYDCARADTVRIICNSIINDEEMLAAIRPNILVFADPIFHFGCSTYARAFRQQLLKAAASHDFDILIPLKFYPLFTARIPELKDRVIGIPHYGDMGINVDLGADFRVNSIDNILTYLMIPVGASLAKNLYLIGCDGRPLEQDDYFWSHNDKTQFPAEMQSIRKAHPSFFETDYNEYYLNHCRNLEKYAEVLEADGHKLYSMWGSHIPALTRRLRIAPALKTDTIVISINPDLASDFGHWAHYDRRLAESTGDLFVTLTNKKLSINPVEFFAVPTFSDDVFAMKNKHSLEAVRRLDQEFSQAVRQITESLNPAVKLKFIMYSGDITYIDALAPVLYGLGGRATLSLNLFYAHFDYDVTAERFVRHEALYESIATADLARDYPWLRLFVDSEKMQQILQTKFGIETALWPMVNLDVNPHVIDRIGPKLRHREKLVVFPGNGQLAKGFDLACDFISKYGLSLSHKYRCRFVLREMFRDSPANNAMMQSKLDIVAARSYVDKVSGTLSEEDFLKLFYHADVIVLPYRRQSFYSRTSSCVVNSILAGVPVLATGDCWMSDQVTRFHAGLTFPDGDIDAMYKTLCRLLEGQGPATDLEEAQAFYTSGRILPAVT